MTRDDVSRSNLPHLWNLAPTLLARNRTSRMENAARRRGQGRRNFTLKGAWGAGALHQRVGDRGGIEQRLWIGVEGPRIEVIAGGGFGSGSGIHHSHPGRDMAHARKGKGQEEGDGLET